MTDEHLWHPFANMARVPGNEVTLVDGDGSWVTDAEGKRYLDASAALWFCSVRHGRAELADAAAAQMGRVAAYYTFDVFANEPALELARWLAADAPTGQGSAAFFTTGGTESFDTAAKLARRYWHVRGDEERRILIAREGAYHDMAAFGTSLAGIAPNRAGWGPLVEAVVHVDAHDSGALAEALERHPGEVAAFIGEPVIGAGGVYPPREGYWEQVQALCREHDVLLIADEVITGFGRLGTAFGCERYGIIPDLLCGAKGISSGYAPLGVVLSGARVRDVLWSPEAGAIRHGYTYSGHAAACAVALANLDVLERDGLYDRVRALEPVLAEALGPLTGHRPGAAHRRPARRRRARLRREGGGARRGRARGPTSALARRAGARPRGAQPAALAAVRDHGAGDRAARGRAVRGARRDRRGATCARAGRCSRRTSSVRCRCCRPAGARWRAATAAASSTSRRGWPRSASRR